MWRLALVLAVVAGCCDACPESCECRQLRTAEDLAVLGEAVCLGKAPLLVELSSTTRRLRILDVEESEVLELLGELENGASSLPYLDEFEFANCSLTAFNASLWSPGIERMRTLNVSRNRLADLAGLRAASQANTTSLRTLDLSDNRVKELGDDTFRTLPGLVRLRLRGNRVSRVEARAFLGLGCLEDLDISDNRLVSLPANALTPLASLQKLDLSGNQLQVLGAGWFESLGRLRELDVSRNGLARAASGALQPLPGLSVLRLAGNPLRERDVSLLLGTGRKLETVDASRTGLIRVPAALTRSVRALRLAGNKLTSVRGGDLDSYPLLRFLDMSDNRLTNVEDDALGRLEVLDDLDVSGNYLTDVPRSLPVSLTALNLDRNRIRILRSNDLQGLYNLRELFLRSNAIAEIQEGSLGQLSALETLDISDNPVKELPANTLNGPTRLNTLRMSGLTGLQWSQREQGDMAFPVPGPERLVDLDVSGSPVLAAQLLADTAALSACKSLLRLNLERTNLTTLRSDLIYFVPQLRALGLAGNPWCCTEDIYWLGDWSRDHEELEPPAECAEDAEAPGHGGIYLRELPSPPTPPSTSLSTGYENVAKSDAGIRPADANATASSYLDASNVTFERNGTADDGAPGSPTPGTTPFGDDEDPRAVSTSETHPPASSPGSTIPSVETARASRGKDPPGEGKIPPTGVDRNADPESKKRPNEATAGSGRTVAEELSGRAADSGARISEALSAGAHPGMLVLVGAALGAVAALSVVLSRRATARRRDCCYQRQENIEVHTLTPVTELW